MTIETIHEWASFGGKQRVFAHQSTSTQTRMEFAVYEPPATGLPPLTLYFLSGLTCTWENFVTKAGAQRAAAEHGVTLVCPDTSPRGDDVPDRPDENDLGKGAGFYLNASEEPWAKNYRMYDYVRHELPELVEQELGLPARRAISGHSMGGHGALTLGLKSPAFYQSISALSPIVAPTQVPWGKKAFASYFGDGSDRGVEHDACALVESRGYDRPLFVDQGAHDQFLEEQLRPELLKNACEAAGVPLRLRLHEGYDHSYYFIATFISDHIAWHRKQAAQAR